MIRTLFIAISLACFGVMAHAATQAQAQEALKSAQAAQDQAFTAKAAWTSTEAALAASKKALADGQWDEAKTKADLAKDMALQSIQQANEQKTLWKNAVYH
jgi:predicted dienelactone hydrolase